MLARNQTQGRCVIQSPKLDLYVKPYQDEGFMLINITKDNQRQLVFTFSREDWNPSTESPRDRDGILSIHTKSWTQAVYDLYDDPQIGLTMSGSYDMDLRKPIWSASTDKNLMETYSSAQGETVFFTAVTSNFEGKDPETGETVTLFTFLTDQKYSTDKMGLLLEFKYKKNNPARKGIPDFVIPLSVIPDLTPLLECIK